MTKEKEEEIKIPEKFKDLIEKIENLSVKDLAELVKILEKKFGVSAVPQVVAPAVSLAKEEEKKEEKSAFDVVLSSVGEKKIEVIKIVRDVTGKGLKDSKDLVDKVAGGEAQLIKSGVKKEEAEELKKRFESAGAKVELK